MFIYSQLKLKRVNKRKAKQENKLETLLEINVRDNPSVSMTVLTEYTFIAWSGFLPNNPWMVKFQSHKGPLSQFSIS